MDEFTVSELILKLRGLPHDARVRFDITAEWERLGGLRPAGGTRIAHPIPADVEAALDAESAVEAGEELTAHQVAALLLAGPDHPVSAVDEHGATQSPVIGVREDDQLGVALDIRTAGNDG